MGLGRRITSLVARYLGLSDGTVLTVGAVSDGQVLTRSGTSIVGSAASTNATTLAGETPTAFGLSLLTDGNAADALETLEAGAVGGVVFAAATEVAAQTAIGLGARPVALSTATSAQTASHAQDLGDGFIVADDGTNNNSIRAYYWAGTSITIKCRMRWNANTLNHQAGIVLRDNSGKYVSLFIYMDGSGNLSMIPAKWNSHNGFNANYGTGGDPAVPALSTRFANTITAGVPFYLRCLPDGANWVASWSMDGAMWTQHYSRPNTDFLSAVNFVGVAVNPGAVSQPLSLEVIELTKS